MEIKNIKTGKVFFATLLSLLLIVISYPVMGYKYLSINRLKWSGVNPIIYYQVNPDLQNSSIISDNTIIEIIKNTADIWFRQGQARFSFTYSGTTGRESVNSYDDINCDSDRIGPSEGNQSLIFFSLQNDPDCTGKSCAFIWNCSNKNDIVHADIQVNSANYEITDQSEPNDSQLNLSTELLHSFGHVIGLDHCEPGDTDSACSEKLGDSEQDPLMNSVMHRFTENVQQLSDDDISGIQSLYGIQDFPFPGEGAYAMSNEDLHAIVDHLSLEQRYGFTTKEKQNKAAEYGRNLADYVTTKIEGKSLLAMTNEFYDGALLTVEHSSEEDLEIGRRLITVGMFVTHRMIRDAREGNNGWDVSFLEHVLEKQRALRNATIEALEAMK